MARLFHCHYSFIRHGEGRLGSAWSGRGWQGKATIIAIIKLSRRGAAKRGEDCWGEGVAKQGGHGKVDLMPKKRQPKEIWQVTRERIWQRDGKVCVRCQVRVALTNRQPHPRLIACHIDHIRSGKLGTNEDSNLRTLCRRCHVLRSDFRHRGMIANALRDGIIPPNWRELVWDD